MDSIEAMLLAGGGCLIVLAIVGAFFRPKLGGDHRRGGYESGSGDSSFGGDCGDGGD